jgi:intracellular multiplication protein IcmG
MVSRAGENEMRNVTVGDTLPGVGRVTQIYQSPTGWIVQGTDGRILQ